MIRIAESPPRINTLKIYIFTSRRIREIIKSIELSWYVKSQYLQELSCCVASFITFSSWIELSDNFASIFVFFLSSAFLLLVLNYIQIFKLWYLLWSLQMHCVFQWINFLLLNNLKKNNYTITIRSMDTLSCFFNDGIDILSLCRFYLHSSTYFSNV